MACLRRRPASSRSRTQRPATTAKVFGILAMVFGVLNGCYNALTAISSALQRHNLDNFGRFPGGASMPSAFDATLDSMRVYAEATVRYAMIEAGLMIPMGIALFVIGLGLLRRSDTARRAAIVWAAVALVVLVVRAIAFETIVMPPAVAAFEAMGKGIDALGASAPRGAPAPSFGGIFGAMGAFARIGGYLTLFVLAIFPPASSDS